MDILKKLTKEDFNVIIEALEYLPEKGETGFLVAGMLKSVTAPTGQPDSFKQELNVMTEKHVQRKKKLKEKSVILMSKIIMIKQELFPEN